jgi:hypothetical protein
MAATADGIAAGAFFHRCLERIERITTTTTAGAHINDGPGKGILTELAACDDRNDHEHEDGPHRRGSIRRGLIGLLTLHGGVDAVEVGGIGMGGGAHDGV